jgi:5'-3' exonuclease
MNRPPRGGHPPFRRADSDAGGAWDKPAPALLLPIAFPALLVETRGVKLHLVDGTFELFRAFYSAPSRRNADGQEVGATLGILRSYSSLLSVPGVTHVAVAYDHVIESFRNQLFPGYKTGDGIEPALWSQAGLVEEAASALGLVMWPMVEFEADDAMATAAYRWRDAVEQVVLCSPDKDLAQCLTSDNVVTWDRIRDRTLDRAGVPEKFGVAPESIPDYLALVGDTADGIPGIPRWGAKSAGAVLSHYKHLEAIPAEASQWAIKVRGAEALADNLKLQLDQAKLYRTLATLRFDVPLAESLEDLTFRGVDGPALTLLCVKLGEPDLAERLIAKHGVRPV